MVQRISRLTLPPGFDVFWADSHEVKLITVPGRLDIFEIRSSDGLIVWTERNAPALMTRGTSCARCAISNGRYVLEMISLGRPSDSVYHMIPLVEVMAMAVMDAEAARACRAAIDLRRVTRMSH
jgi:hypothetical protein